MRFRFWTAAAVAAALVVSASMNSFASGKGGGGCGDCPMSPLTAEQRTDIRARLSALKESGADGDEIKAFKAGILEEYGVEMPEGRKGQGRNRKGRGRK